MLNISVDEAAHAVAEAIARAISEKNIRALGSVYSDDCVIWHNFDNKSQTREENLALLESSFQLLKYIRYINIRRELTESGYVQQHVLSGESHEGQRIEIPFCQVCVVRNGRLVRMDEYFDPTQLSKILPR